MPAGLRVLLVEDDADVRDVVRAFLDSLHCRVTQAASGEQALLALGPDADFDLLLSDIALGAGMRGTRLAALAQQRLPKLCGAADVGLFVRTADWPTATRRSAGNCCASPTRAPTWPPPSPS